MAAQLRETFETNVFGVVTVTSAFVSLLRAAVGGRVINVSSPLGSLGLRSDFDSDVAGNPLLAYGASKAALNAVTLMTRALRADRVAVNAVDPGYVGTNLNGHNGILTTEQGAEVAVKLALCGPDGPTGLFVGGEDRGRPDVAASRVEWHPGLGEALVPW